MTLYEFRIGKGMSIRRLAWVTDIPRATIHRWEQEGVPTAEDAARLSVFTDGKCSVEELLFPGGAPAGVVFAKAVGA